MADTQETKTKVVEEYVNKISKDFVADKATEHSYRPALVEMLSKLLSNFIVRNEERRIECGAPDITISKGQDNASIPVAYIETKDVGDNDLDGNRITGNKEQFDRYKKALSHIVFTDYLDFHLYEEGAFVDSVRIADVKGCKIAIINDNIPKFIEMVGHLANATPQKITSPKQLAKIMAAKAKLLADIILRTLEIENEEKDDEKKGALSKQWIEFQHHLITDLSQKSFSDIYAQTIAYGMFAARLHDKTPETFSRLEAAELIPKTNPFLRKIFQNIATFGVEESIVWIINDLVEIFKVTDIHNVMKNFGDKSGTKDPMTYFYEFFLKEYDPDLIKKYGVFYTPLPVVTFIVNSVDEILKKSWNLPMGLADYSKVQLKQSNALYTDNRTKTRKRFDLKEYHKVQVLDPAAGTGTFLTEVINKIWENVKGDQGAWQNYVEEHLLPRLNGFEIMMAPYAIAHLKMDMVLSQKGYVSKSDRRLKIFLTNALENTDNNIEPLFFDFLATEAKEANRIKKDTPVMVMLGNPPYSNFSSNKSSWILEKINDYKEGLNETKINLDDDYIKFIRLGQYYIEKNDGGGILAYITNNSFIDEPTRLQMRKSLMDVFDEIYILNLHGSQIKGETNDGKDQNIFKIRSGVSINIFVKKNLANQEKKRNCLAEVYYYDVYGKRSDKFNFLNTMGFSKIPWIKLKPCSPNYYYIPKDLSAKPEYVKGFKIDELMSINNSGIKTDRDTLFYDYKKEQLSSRILKLLSHSYNEEDAIKYDIRDSSSYKLSHRIDKKIFDEQKIRKCCFKPLDSKYIYYDETIISRPAYPVMKHLLKKNIALIATRKNRQLSTMYFFATNGITDIHFLDSGADSLRVFPLYLHPSEAEAKLGETPKPNLEKKIWDKINKIIKASSTPEQIFDYIYGVLFTPSYQMRFKEFLKDEIPRIPYPKNKACFEKIAALGTKLRKLHLAENDVNLQSFATSFPISGEDNKNMVDDIRFEKDCENQNNDAAVTGKVFINKKQYFANVPEIAWNLFIGGYKPAQLWLKNRMNKSLTYEETQDFHKIIAILEETYKLMKELDLVHNYSTSFPS